MGQLSNILTGIGFSLIVVIGFISWYAEGNTYYDSVDLINVTGFNYSGEYISETEALYSTSTSNSNINVDAGEIIFQGGISFLTNLLDGTYFSMLYSLISNSLVSAGINGVLIAIFIGVVTITIFVSIVVALRTGDL